ncbi:hypothetical protein GCM10027589_20580 [Actinocorallia lasiicapitis]
MKPQRPPLLAWFRYRLLDKPLPDDYRAWALADLNSRYHSTWNNLALLITSQAVTYVIWSAYASIRGGAPVFDEFYGGQYLYVLLFLAVIALSSAVLPGSPDARERRLDRHGFTADGTPK